MSNHFPIPSPPPELVQQWENRIFDEQENVDVLLIEAYKAGADQELEACCEWLDIPNNRSDRGDGWLVPGRLRATRRPQPPSLKEQALEAAIRLGKKYPSYEGADIETIRRALEALDDGYSSGPTTPKPDITPKPQFPPPQIIREDFLR